MVENDLSLLGCIRSRISCHEKVHLDFVFISYSILRELFLWLSVCLLVFHYESYRWACICLTKSPDRNLFVCSPLLMPRCAEQVVILLSSEWNCREQRTLSTAHLLIVHFTLSRKKKKKNKIKRSSFMFKVHLPYCMHICLQALGERAWVSTCVLVMTSHLSSPLASRQLPKDESEWNLRLVGLHSQLRLFI